MELDWMNRPLKRRVSSRGICCLADHYVWGSHSIHETVACVICRRNNSKDRIFVNIGVIAYQV